MAVNGDSNTNRRRVECYRSPCVRVLFCKSDWSIISKVYAVTHISIEVVFTRMSRRSNRERAGGDAIIISSIY